MRLTAACRLPAQALHASALAASIVLNLNIINYGPSAAPSAP